ncbi:MAG: helix-turn-helix transcriptional regulator [Lachnospiraceae bacterium]|nr:helix-turn-helix transcriptional regulator [Lachnospiraceae bacterium]
MIRKEISERIQEILEQRGISVYVLARNCEDYISQTSVYSAANGEGNLTVESLNLICKGLDMTIGDFFAYNAGKEPVLDEREKKLIENFRSVDENYKGRLEGYMASLKEMSEQ